MNIFLLTGSRISDASTGSRYVPPGLSASLVIVRSMGSDAEPWLELLVPGDSIPLSPATSNSRTV